MSVRLEYTSEHRQFRDMVREFVQQTVVPAHEEWEKAGCVDRSLFTEAGKLGLLAFSVPEEFGGPGVEDFRYNAIVVDELQRAGAAAEAIALSLQNDIVLPYLTPSIASRWVRLVTPVPSGLARPLIESLECDAVMKDNDIDDIIPRPEGGLQT